SFGGVFWFAKERDRITQGESGAAGTSRIIDAWLKLENPATWDQYDEKSIDELVQDGHDSVKLEDSQETDYIVFSPNQIKSAAPFTFDENGELIPLDQR